MSKFLRFEEATAEGRKTKIVQVRGIKNDILLGEISFFPAWRKYVFYPSWATTFDGKCLNEIIAKLNEMNTEIRKEWQKRKAFKEKSK